MCAIVDILLILIVILFILLIWRGPSMLPQLGEALGKAVKGVRENVDGGARKQDHGAGAPEQDHAAVALEQDHAAVAPEGDVADRQRDA
jgi:Sec-independent protein translocase protein TatA